MENPFTNKLLRRNPLRGTTTPSLLTTSYIINLEKWEKLEKCRPDLNHGRKNWLGTWKNPLGILMAWKAYPIHAMGNGFFQFFHFSPFFRFSHFPAFSVFPVFPFSIYIGPVEGSHLSGLPKTHSPLITRELGHSSHESQFTYSP